MKKESEIFWLTIISALLTVSKVYTQYAQWKKESEIYLLTIIAAPLTVSKVYAQ